MSKWFLGFFLSVSALCSLNGNLLHSECFNPCQPQNYNGLAVCALPCEFYFPPCDRPCGGDVNFYFQGNFGESISTSKDYITLGALGRQFFCCYETFINAKWNYFTNYKNSANLGLGIRTFDMYNFVAGANIYYDYRRGPCHGDFHQFSGGFELFHPCFSFYINGYLPLQRKKRCKTKVFLYDDGFFAACRSTVYSLPGFDLELDKPLFYVCKARVNAGIGGYFYNNSARSCCTSEWFAGGRLRLVADVSTNLRLEVEGTYDNTNKTKVMGKIAFNFPFPSFGNARKCSGCVESWCPPLPQRRNDLIVLRRQTCWDWNFDDADDLFDTSGMDIGFYDYSGNSEDGFFIY